MRCDSGRVIGRMNVGLDTDLEDGMGNRFAWCEPVARVRPVDTRDLYRRTPHPPLTDYRSAVAAAIASLGNRYLLARPVNAMRHEPSR